MRRIDILQDIDRLDLFDAVPAIILMLDETGRILYFNAFMEALGGYSLKEVRGKDWFELFLPEREIKRVREIFAEALAGHATRGNINAIITKSGEERLIRWYDQVMNTEQQGRHYLLATGVDITERRKAEESQSLLHSLVDNSNDAIEVIEPGTLRFLYVNDTECRQLGYSREELLGMSVNDIDIMSAEQVKVAEEQIRRKGSARFETIHRRKDGSSFPVEISVKLIELDKPYLLSIARDISKRKRAELALADSEQRFRQLFENMTAAFAVHEIICDADGKPSDYRFLEVNPAFERLTGIAADGLIGRTVLEVLPGTEAYWIETYGKVALTGESVSFQNYSKEFDRYYDVRAFSPAPRRFATIFSDITERKQAEQVLQISEARLKEAQQVARLGSWELDLVKNDLWWSEENYRVFGVTPGTRNTYETFLERVHPDDRAYVDKEYSGSVKNRTQYDIEHRLLMEDGSIKWVNERCTTYYADDGTPLRSSGTTMDITERKQAEERLRVSEERFQLAMAGSNDGIWDWNLETDDVYYSPRWFSMLGYEADAFPPVLDTWGALVHPDDKQRVLDAVVDHLEGRADKVDLEFRMKHRDGHEVFVLSRAFKVLRESDGKPIRLVGTHVDITERKTHEMLLQARLRLNDMASQLDHRQLMQITLDLAEELTNSNIGFFHFVDEDEEAIFLQAWSTHTLEEMCTIEGVGMHYPVSEAGVWADAIRSQKPVIHDDYASLPDKQGMPEGHAKVLRLATVPLIRNDKVVAVIGIGNKPQPYDDRDIDMLSQLANLAWNVIQVKKAETALEHANRALMTLGTVNRELVHATDEVKLMQSVCTAIVEQRGYRMAWVGYAQDNAARDIEVVASAGVPEDLLAAIRPGWGEDARSVGPTGRAVRTGKTQLCRDIAGEPQHDWKQAMLEAGCASDVALPLTGEAGGVFGVLHVYADEVDAFTDQEIGLLEEMAGDLAFGVDVLRVRRERDEALSLSEQHLAMTRRNLEQTIASMSKTVEARDPYTAGHQRRVAELAVAIGRRMGLDADALQGIHLGATIHDIGKINIPAEILSKPSQLNDMELQLVRGHAGIGYDILKDIDFPWPVAEVAHQHHERMDGSGYPQGLKGDEIRLEARIVAVADVVEAMGSHRPYRPGLGHERALAEITDNCGRLYDAAAVDACLAVFADGFHFD